LLSEKQIIKDCHLGKKSGQYELVKRYSAMLMTVCRRYLLDETTHLPTLFARFSEINSITKFNPPMVNFPIEEKTSATSPKSKIRQSQLCHRLRKKTILPITNLRDEPLAQKTDMGMPLIYLLA